MTDRVLLGALGGGLFGMKVSKPGVSVTSALDKELVFNSLKDGASLVHVTGVAAFGATVGFTSLGYVPAVMGVLVDGSTVATWDMHNWETDPVGSPAYQGFVRVSYPALRVSASSLEILNPGPDLSIVADNGDFFPSNSFSVRYIVLRLPGG